MSCSGLYFVMQAHYEYRRLEERFKRRLRRTLEKYGWL
jgi:hypothetical protein